MAKRSKPPQPPAEALRQPAGRRPRPDIVHSSLYLPEAVYEALRETAFKERCKIHDLVLQGIDLALRKRGYPPVEQLKAGKRRS
jgi:hypothetical protein